MDLESRLTMLTKSSHCRLEHLEQDYTGLVARNTHCKSHSSCRLEHLEQDDTGLVEVKC